MNLTSAISDRPSVAAAAGRQRVVVVDMAVSPTSPAGSCVLAEIQGLSAHFDVTVFSERFEPGAMRCVEFVRVRTPDRPVLLRYVVFHFSVPVHYMLWRLRGGRAACVQATQGQLPGAGICYAHFCHRAYLKQHWNKSSVTGARRWARFAAHRFNAWCEAITIRWARLVVVPSLGLARELASEYPACSSKLRVLANPVATSHFRQPPDFDKIAQRRVFGFDPGHLVLGFMALGDFERKGLGLLLQALAELASPQRQQLRILVIGGHAGEIAEFEALAARLGLAACVRFVGMQKDVRRHLWVCDVFAFPSTYEIFSLAVIQAAAAGLPVLVCNGVYGSEEFVVDGHNGWVVERNTSAVGAWLHRLTSERHRLPDMSAAAVLSVKRYDLETFQTCWTELISDHLLEAQLPPRADSQ
jgi:glycosyltransferase involved in cell wall biosynthesis